MTAAASVPVPDPDDATALELLFIYAGLAFLAVAFLFLLRSLCSCRAYLASTDSIFKRTSSERSFPFTARGHCGDGASPSHVVFRFRQDYHGGSLSTDQYGTGVGVGASIWCSALVLVDLVLGDCRHANDGTPLGKPVDLSEWVSMKDKTCLELGCGLGMVAIASSVLGAKLSVATDGDVALLPLTKENIVANEEACSRAGILGVRAQRRRRMHVAARPAIEVLPLHWGDDAHHRGVLDMLATHGGGGGGDGRGYDVITGADIVYRPATFPGLIDTLEACSTPGHTTFLLGYKPRFPTDVHFFGMLEEHWEEERRIAAKDLRTAFNDPDVVIIQYRRRLEGTGVVGERCS